MPLTTLIRNNTKVKAVLKEISPSKNTFISDSTFPAFSKDAPMIVPYCLENNTDAALVGSTADYLFRFLIARTINKGKETVLKDLIAEGGLALLPDTIGQEIKPKMQIILNDGRTLARKYIYGEEIKEKDLAEFALRLAYLDQFRRSGRLPDCPDEMVNRKDDILINDLLALLDTFKKNFIESGLVFSDSIVIFNPRFGRWGAQCGGADADIYIDGVLYDFKCTKGIYKDWTEIGQIYGYYCLYRLCCEDADNDTPWTQHQIDAIAIYKARYGMINKCFIGQSNADYSKEALNRLRAAIEEDGEDTGKALDTFSKKNISRLKWPFATTSLIKRNIPVGPFKKLIGQRVYVGPILGKGTITGFYHDTDGAHIMIYLDQRKSVQERLIDFLSMDYRMIINNTNIEPGQTILIVGRGYGTLLKIEKHPSFSEMQIELYNKQIISINPEEDEWYRVEKLFPTFDSIIDFPYRVGEKAIWNNKIMVLVHGFEIIEKNWYVLLEERKTKLIYRVPIGGAVLNLSEEKPCTTVRFRSVFTGKKTTIEKMKNGEKVLFINSNNPDRVTRQEGVVKQISKTPEGRLKVIISFESGEEVFLGRQFMSREQSR